MLAPHGDSVDPLIETLPAETFLYRVHSTSYPAAAFHPGRAPARPTTRFSFLGDPPVPALYAAETVDAALSETTLREIPVQGGTILLDQVEGLALSPIVIRRDLQLLQLHGLGFRHVKTASPELTLTSPRQYPQTVRWGQAAFDAGLDGIVWMSRHHNASRAYVFYDSSSATGHDPVIAAHPDQASARAFSIPEHLDWLSRQLAPLDVAIIDKLGTITITPVEVRLSPPSRRWQRPRQRPWTWPKRSWCERLSRLIGKNSIRQLSVVKGLIVPIMVSTRPEMMCP